MGDDRQVRLLQRNWLEEVKTAVSRVLSLFIGLVFVVSALAKLFAIDPFEVYIFSFGFFSLNLSYLLARLCIAVELLLGVALITQLWRRTTAVATLLLLVLFTAFLCYVVLIGRSDSCQCLGQLVDIPPVVSILKNTLLILLTLFYLKSPPAPYKPIMPNRKWRFVPLFLFFMAVAVSPFVISVPDNWLFGPSEENYDGQIFEAAVVHGHALPDSDLSQGSHLVAFFAKGCPYCVMARQKLETMMRRHEWNHSQIHYIYPGDVSNTTFLKITRGQWPIILLLQDGSVKASFHYRNIDESAIDAVLHP